MELALYDSQHGYYQTRPVFGREGDFVTASDYGSVWGEIFAKQWLEMDQLLGNPDPFQVVEFAAGRGWLARDCRAALKALNPELENRLRWAVVERSALMRSRAAEHADVVSLEDVKSLSASVVCAMEWLDALPVDRYQKQNNEWFEIKVGVDEQQNLTEEMVACQAPTLGEWSHQALQKFETFAFEHRPSLKTELEQVRRSLKRGFFIHVDYGDRAEKLWTPATRKGTVVGYRKHQVVESLLSNPGEMDLTAHVNFSEVQATLQPMGFHELGFTTQDRFLIQHGFLEHFEAQSIEASRNPETIARRREAMALIHPQQMGRRFKVQAFGKGMEPDLLLAAFVDPFVR